MISWILLRNTELTQKEGNWPTQKTAELCSYNIVLNANNSKLPGILTSPIFYAF